MYETREQREIEREMVDEHESGGVSPLLRGVLRVVWYIEVTAKGCSSAVTARSLSHGRSIRRCTNDPYGVGPTDCWLDAMAP